MELIDLSTHARDPKYYNRDRDMEVALAWNAIRKTLSELGKEDLFEYIQSVRLTEKNVIITTEKPIVNGELKLFQKEIIIAINTSLSSLKKPAREKLQLR
ncbi:MAG: hypothetical protein PHY14_02060 [Candidatus Gracilibacteria bacterium]|nr:hypothetical protein [Candidatus Gracilibacteria bacterium]